MNPISMLLDVSSTGYALMRWTPRAIQQAQHRLRYAIDHLQKDNLATIKRLVRAPRRAIQARRIRDALQRPLRLLYECSGKQCPNNRLIAPQRRLQFTAHCQESLSGTSQRIMCVFYGAGGLLHEAQLLEMMVEQCAPLAVHVQFIEEQYEVYFDEHDVRSRAPHVLQGICPCGANSQKATIPELAIWTARLESYMAWYLKQYPSIRWTWELAQQVPRQCIAEDFYHVCFVVDGHLPYDLPLGYTTFILTHAGTMLILSSQLEESHQNFTLTKKHASIKYIHRY